MPPSPNGNGQRVPNNVFCLSRVLQTSALQNECEQGATKGMSNAHRSFLNAPHVRSRQGELWLLPPEPHLPARVNQRSLVRALALLGSKGDRQERSEESSPFRLAAERVRDTLVQSGTPTDANVARRFVDSLHHQWLPPIYRISTVDMQTALTEYEMRSPVPTCGWAAQ